MSPKYAEPPITYLDDGINFRLDEEICVYSRGFTLVVPKGRVSDLASIPRVLWNEVAPFQLSIIAPFVHDELYRHGGEITVRSHGPTTLIDSQHTFTRADADAFLLDLALQQGVSPFRAHAAYYAVRCFGGSSWQSAPHTQP